MLKKWTLMRTKPAGGLLRLVLPLGIVAFMLFARIDGKHVGSIMYKHQAGFLFSPTIGARAA